MNPVRSGPPNVVALCLSHLLPGTLGSEAIADLKDEYEEIRERRGVFVARAWYASHLVRPGTWVLAFMLRRTQGRATASRVGLGISWLDIKLGLRMLAKHPGTSLVSGLSMSVTVAIAVGAFSLLQDLLFRPDLPLPEGDRIVSVSLVSTRGRQPSRQLLHDFEIWQEELESVQQLSIWRTAILNLVGEDGTAWPANFTMMTASGFDVSGVAPEMGRPILRSDETTGAQPVMVLGHEEWMVRYGGDPNIVGREVQVGREPYTIVGVMPADYGFPLAAKRWIPFRDDPDDFVLMEAPHLYYVFGRLSAEGQLNEAQAEMSVLDRRRAAQFPETYDNVRAVVMPYTDTFTGMSDGRVRWERWILLLMLSSLVVIPFMNVAILLYARIATRAGELSVRSALGATRRRVVMQLFVEALVMSSLAAAVGAGLALVVLSHVDSLLSGTLSGPSPFWVDMGWNPQVTLYVVVLSLLAAVVAGVIPALKATGPGVQARLNRATSGGGMRLGAGWTALIVTQIASIVAFLPLVASIGWQIFGVGLARPTFEAEQLLGGYVSAIPIDRMEELSVPDPTGQRAVKMERAQLSIDEIVRRLESHPSVTGLSMSTFMPGQLFEGTHYMEVEGVEPPASAPAHIVAAGNRVGEDFFDLLGVEPSAGRVFRAGDAEVESHPVVVNRRFVETVLKNANPIGRHVRNYQEPGRDPDPWMQIVGVVDDLVLNPTHPEVIEPRIFSPLDPTNVASGVYLIVKVPDATQSFLPELRRVVTSVDPTIQLSRVTRVGDLNEVLGSLLGVAAVGFAIVVSSALLLCTAGISSMISLNVTQRRREIGIRSALGADQSRVLFVVMRRSIKQLAIGVAVGLVIVLSIPPINLDGVLVGRDPIPVLFVAIVVMCAGLIGAVGPARRGLRIQPSEALRDG